MYITNIHSNEISEVLARYYPLFYNSGLQSASLHLMEYIDPQATGVELQLSTSSEEEIEPLLIPYLRMLQQEPMVTFILYGKNALIEANDNMSDFMGSLRLFVQDHSPNACLRILTFPVKKEIASHYKVDALADIVFNNKRKRQSG